MQGTRAVLLAALMGPAMATEDIEGFLASFEKNPAEAMDRVPEKREEQGAPACASPLPFPFPIEARDEVRSQIAGDLTLGKALIGPRDRPENLVDVFRFVRPSDIDASGLSSAALPDTPWSSDYWPDYRGVIGRRYADRSFPDSKDWKENHDYVVRFPAASVVASGDQNAIDALSPSEKYDLLVGDAAGTLTAAMWDEGRRLYQEKGSVEPWMGICHGWAPAAYMLPRPRRMVVQSTPDGAVLLRFFPADIKALAALLWANAPPSGMRFIGTRCTEKSPPTDENGRTISQPCFDDNPGAWHLAVVNQIGVAQRSMVMDATYDYEVWNQPIIGYEYHYFNPQTMQVVPSEMEGLVARADFTHDHFARWRGPGYAYALGVAMRTRYIAETIPTHAETDDPSRDRIVSVDYFYDLELDGMGRITGGEWYVNRHPDFLFSPLPGSHAVTPADAFARGPWPPGQPIPPSWRIAAVRASASSLPLARIVERLIALSAY